MSTTPPTTLHTAMGRQMPLQKKRASDSTVGT